MPFDWMCNKVNPAFRKKIANRFVEMHLTEIEQRARLLMNLRFRREAAIRAIQRNIAWEFELSKLPAFHKDVSKIVDRVYGKGK
jgi:hypothetical protein